MPPVIELYIVIAMLLAMASGIDQPASWRAFFFCLLWGACWPLHIIVTLYISIRNSLRRSGL